MSSLELMLDIPLVFLGLIGLSGLIMGSFLNVVIHRLPIMLDRAWRGECRELLGLEPPPPESPLNLLVPRSRCPHCGHTIRPAENIPLLSYGLLRGRCSACAQPISPRYPLVEALTAVLSVAVAWRFGATWATLAALLLTWCLIALSGIDFDTQLLPDALTLPLLWLGLLVNIAGTFTDLSNAVIGAIAGYTSLWLVYQIFKRLTGKEGMGYGDFKLLATFGAWLGWQMLLPVILLSSIAGSLIGGLLIATRQHDSQLPMPFGPYIAIAGWIALVWGHTLVDAYLRWAHLA
jgi:leader peptidase (prepilin peptidase) / N-methyltransferase